MPPKRRNVPPSRRARSSFFANQSVKQHCYQPFTMLSTARASRLRRNRRNEILNTLILESLFTYTALKHRQAHCQPKLFCHVSFEHDEGTQRRYSRRSHRGLLVVVRRAE